MCRSPSQPLALPVNVIYDMEAFFPSKNPSQVMKSTKLPRLLDEYPRGLKQGGTSEKPNQWSFVHLGA